ncbi:DNA-directed RNA polymerase III subunit rpc7 [Gigaspora margarita]|uniref:DNA-directed RNA polymerase III subunit rpc7 n=1 Tax=Gigaspora margarita TaxID=4874 RepID=A0A8H4AN38_GIGMA|nr:DNA-directed RNA polymerase III subunit rpc7 [Gigaspora margarita]
MASRGIRGGRGIRRRGFGMRGGPPDFGGRSFSNELRATLQRNFVDESSKGLEFEDPVPPTDSEQSTLYALVGYKAALKDSAFYISAPPPPSEIQRYSDQFKKKKTSRSLRDIKTDIAFFPDELHCVKDESLTSTVTTNIAIQKRVAFDLDQTFGDLLAQEDKEQTKKQDTGAENEFEKYTDMDQFLQEEDELADATDYVESYFDNGEGDDLDDDGGGGGEAYFD